MAQHQRSGCAHTKADQIDLPGFGVVQYLLPRMTGIHDHFNAAPWINLGTKHPSHLLTHQLFTSRTYSESTTVAAVMALTAGGSSSELT
jgi:hypothetical protein